MISENELTQYPELLDCVKSGRLISDKNLPDMKGFYPVVDRYDWQIKGFFYADAPNEWDGRGYAVKPATEYRLAIFDFNDGKIFESEDGDFLVEAE